MFGTWSLECVYRQGGSKDTQIDGLELRTNNNSRFVISKYRMQIRQ